MEEHFLIETVSSLHQLFQKTFLEFVAALPPFLLLMFQTYNYKLNSFQSVECLVHYRKYKYGRDWKTRGEDNPKSSHRWGVDGPQRRPSSSRTRATSHAQSPWACARPAARRRLVRRRRPPLSFVLLPRVRVWSEGDWESVRAPIDGASGNDLRKWRGD